MRGLLFLGLFIGIPLIEIALFVQIGGRIGIVWTIVIVIATAMAGTALLRMQGLAVMNDARRTLDAGGVPVDSLIDGLFLLIAGILLLTPGFLTDAVGFLFFVPPFRRGLGRWLWRQAAKSGNVHFHHMKRGGSSDGRSGGIVIEGEVVDEARDKSDEDENKPDIVERDSDPDSPWRR